MAMVKEQLVSARVSEDLRKILEQLAQSERRTLSNYIALVLERHVEAIRQAVAPSPEVALDHVASLATDALVAHAAQHKAAPDRPDRGTLSLRCSATS